MANNLLTKYQDRIRELEKENKQLSEKIDELLVTGHGGMTATEIERLESHKYNTINLQPQEQTLLISILRHRDGISKSGLMHCIYKDQHDKWHVDPKIIDIYVWRVRNKIAERTDLPRHTVETLPRVGYRIHRDYRDQLIDLLGIPPGMLET